MKILTPTETAKLRDLKKIKTKEWKDPANHKFYIGNAGTYESVILYCETCKLAYQLTKKEVDDLP